MSPIRSIGAMCVMAAAAFAARGEVSDFESETAATIAHRFAALAGNEENAVALALSLRSGDRVTLVHDDGGARVPATFVFELPTRAMQWDDVRICLALTEDSLVRRGIRRPTPEQLEVALRHVLETLSDGVEWKDRRVRVRGKGS